MEKTRPIDKREEINQRNRKKRRRLYVVAAAVLLALFAVFLVIMLQTREFANYKVISQTDLYSNVLGYRAGNGLFYLYSNDGAKALSEDGEVKWEMSYHLDNPSIEYCQDVAAVADIGGTSVYVVAENGIPYNYQVLYPIVKHAVAKQGVTAVLLDNGTEDYIQLYDISGKLRVDINTKTKSDGIPVDITLSEDGKKLVTLYVTFQGSQISSKVTFYNAGEVGKNYIGNIVGQKTFDENVLVYDIGFLKEDYVYILYENGFSVYRMKEVPELIKEEIIENEITDIAVMQDGIYVIEKLETGQTRMCYYSTDGGVLSDLGGKQVWSDIPEYEKLVATDEEVLFFSPQSVTIYRANKSLKYEGNFQSSAEAIFPIGGNKYFLVNVGKLQTIKLTNSKQNEGE